MILAIDPGSTESAWLIYNPKSGTPQAFGKVSNEDMMHLLDKWCGTIDHMAIEMIASYGMPVGKEVFDTCVWIGRFMEASPCPQTRVYRKDVKLHLCGSMKAKDANIRQALIDKFGGPDAIGKKANPGPLYGISADVWSALGVAITYAETVRE